MSRLLKNSAEFRDANRAWNTYNEKDYYNTGHPNALSDGDELGKGKQGNAVGGATDIKKRAQSLTRNRYNSANEYGINNA